MGDAQVLNEQGKDGLLTYSENNIKHPRTLWQYLFQGFVAAHRRRPLSFYLLLLIPIVLLLGAHISEYRESPLRFVTLLTLLLVFFWLIIVQAINDLFALYRKHLTEKHTAYLDTIGNPDFAETLGKQVRQNTPGK